MISIHEGRTKFPLKIRIPVVKGPGIGIRDVMKRDPGDRLGRVECPGIPGHSPADRTRKDVGSILVDKGYSPPAFGKIKGGTRHFVPAIRLRIIPVKIIQLILVVPRSDLSFSQNPETNGVIPVAAGKGIPDPPPVTHSIVLIEVVESFDPVRSGSDIAAVPYAEPHPILPAGPGEFRF